MSRVLVTGAGGFVGNALCRHLASRGFEVVAGVRSGKPPPSVDNSQDNTRSIGNLDDEQSLADAAQGVECIVHLAARAHVMSEKSGDPLPLYRRVNVAGTRLLARVAAKAGVRRFVFLSSIKVNGERTEAKPFTEDDPAAPEDAYGISKWEAEQALGEAGAAEGIETVILRSPLVYGPDMRANFLALLRICDSGLPLPFGAITANRRSMIYLGNLVDAIKCALSEPAAVGKCYLVSDREDVSTADLIRRLRSQLNRPARLMPVPPAMLRAGLALAGQGAAADRLLGSLQVDASRIARDLGWSPPYGMDDGLADTIAWYRGDRAGPGTRPGAVS